MAFHGDLSSYPLPELLQWVDSSRKTGTLQLDWEAGERKLFLMSGAVVATSSQGLWDRIARALDLARLAQGRDVLAAFRNIRATGDVEGSFKAKGLPASFAAELARDELYGATADFTSAQNGTFHWTEDPDPGGEEWVKVEVGIRELLFEGLRWLDEQPQVERALPSDGVAVRTLVKPQASQPLLHRIILTLCERGQTLGQLRLALGMSRSSLTRRLYDLLHLGWLEVEGAPRPDSDPVGDMLRKGTVLLKEGQFDAAGLLFAALLSSDPSDRRVREFARLVEREHVGALYRDLSPMFIPELVNDPESLSLLRAEERQVAALVNGTWDVSAIVLASQVRELETLKCLSKLNRMGLLRVVEPPERRR